VIAEVITERGDGVLTVTLNRPERLNALSFAVQRELSDIWATTRRDSTVRCILLTGAGRAFCSGADVADLAAMTGPRTEQTARIEFCPAASVDVPVVLAVNGLCVGAGLRLLADADVVVASDQAWFSDPHVTVGQLGTPVALALAEKASSVAVAQLFLSGSRFRMTAQQALAAGMIGEVVAAADLAARAREIALAIASQSPSAARATVTALRQRHRIALAGQLEQAWADVAIQQVHPDATEGARAFAEGGAPRWTDADTEGN
jgi:enoyl-CoA hydratase/carnithine racemase